MEGADRFTALNPFPAAWSYVTSLVSGASARQIDAAIQHLHAAKTP